LLKELSLKELGQSELMHMRFWFAIQITGGDERMPHVGERKDQIEVLGAFRKALRREFHNLLDQPETIW